MSKPSHVHVEWDAKKVGHSFEVIEELTNALNDRYASILEEYSGNSSTFLENQTLAGDWLYRFIESIISGCELAKIKSVVKTVNHIPIFLTTNTFIESMHQKRWHDHIYYMICCQLEGKKCPVSWLEQSSVGLNLKPNFFQSLKYKLIESNRSGRSATFAATKFHINQGKFQSLCAQTMLRQWSNTIKTTELRNTCQVDSCFREYHFKSWQPSTDGVSLVGFLCLKLLPLYLPVELLEGRFHIENQVSALSRFRTPILFSGGALHGNSYFKHLVNLWRRDGTKLLYQQHGGGYGILARLGQEDYERKVADHYLTWGWTDDKGGISVLKPGINRVKQGQRTESNLLVCLDLPNVPYQIMYAPMPNRIETLAKQTAAFLKQFNRPLSIKPYPIDYGNKMVERMSMTGTNADIQTLTSPGISFHRHSLIICNSLGTTWLESIGAGVPTICFFDEEIYKFRKDAMGIMQNLKNVGILHTSGESAARFANSLGRRSADWWSTGEVQSAVYSLSSNLCGFDENWLKTWQESIHEHIQ